MNQLKTQSKSTWLYQWIESNLAWTCRLGCSAAIATAVFSCGAIAMAADADPQVTKALSFKPRQANVSYDLVDPTDIANCTARFEARDGVDGLSIYSPSGQLIRRFLDTNNDRQVDQWCYFKDGIEVYRDIDSDFNSTADEYRWLGTNGTRWALDKNEDGVIDGWKRISPEELTIEVIEALKSGDTKRFRSLLLNSDEMTALGLGEEKASALASRIESTVSGFEDFVKSQKSLKNFQPTTRWAHFAADKPGLIPAGTEGSTKDVVAYENVIAIVEDGGASTQVFIGTIVQVDGLWKLTDCPRIITEGNAVADGGFFFPAVAANRSATTPVTTGGLSSAMQALLVDLEKLDSEIAAQPEAKKLASLHNARSETLMKLIDAAKGTSEMELWVRQFVDSVSSATMQSEFDGMPALRKMETTLSSMSGGKELLPYVVYSMINTEYQVESLKPNANFSRLQDKYMEQLESFADKFSSSPFAADAMIQIALNSELSAEEENAKKWYNRVVTDFSNTIEGKKAKGALNRLNLENRKFAISGKTIDNKTVETAKFAGKPIVIHYWASWCEPCKQDMAALQKLLSRRPNAFQVVGINLDNNRDRAILALEQTQASWPHIFDGQAFESDLAVGLGVLSVPVTILIDKDGVVAMSGTHFSSDMEANLESMLVGTKAPASQATGNARPNNVPVGTNANAGRQAPNIPANARVGGTNQQGGQSNNTNGSRPGSQPPRK